MREHGVLLEGIQRVCGKERNLLGHTIVQLRKRRRNLRKPNRQVHLELPYSADLGQYVEELPEIYEAVGEYIAFSHSALVGRRDNAVRDVAHVHEVKASAHRRGQLAAQKHMHKVVDVAALARVRPDNTGRMHHYRVKADLDRIKYDLCRLRFCLGVASAKLIGFEVGDFLYAAALRQFRQSVYRADVDKALYLVLLAQPDNVLSSRDVHLGHKGIVLAVYADNARAVNEHAVLTVHTIEQPFQGAHVRDVALVLRKVRVVHTAAFLGQNKGANLPVVLEQIGNYIAAEMSRGSGYNICQSVHGVLLSMPLHHIDTMI